ncbi:MAG: THUMP domain-containing protein [Chitinophagales bacterium]|nr:THUMP domain-containing protein [Chitinophagales bacterium]
MDTLRNYTATTLFGLENTLATELKQLGAKEIKELNRAVSFVGDKHLMYKANLWLRTALKVLQPIHQFTATNEEQLYNGVKQVDWSAYLSADETLALESAVNSTFFNHSKYVALKAKDAIVDQFRNRYGRRPNVDLENPTVRIHLHIFKDQCTLSLDSSGESLHKRGYRTSNALAPLSEVLAAGLVLLSGWDGQSTFIDPMCGSGTIVIEAGLIAKNMAPGMQRSHFGFMNWNDYDEDAWQELLQAAISNQKETELQLIGSDIAAGPIALARENVVKAGLDEDIKILKRPFEELVPPVGGGTVVINPPYGERLELADVMQFYKSIGDTLKKNFDGYDVWILSSNKEAMKNIGLRTSKKLTLYNGPLECKFHHFSMYRGSKKGQNEES